MVFDLLLGVTSDSNDQLGSKKIIQQNIILMTQWIYHAFRVKCTGDGDSLHKEIFNVERVKATAAFPLASSFTRTLYSYSWTLTLYCDPRTGFYRIHNAFTITSLPNLPWYNNSNFDSLLGASCQQIDQSSPWVYTLPFSWQLFIHIVVINVYKQNCDPFKHIWPIINIWKMTEN